MRYYRIEIADENGNSIADGDGNPIGPWDTTDNPSGALNVVFDAQTLGQDLNYSGTTVSIYGLPLSFLSQSVNLLKAQFTMYAGFQAGLPLANPAQSGMIIQGVTYKAYGNWEGINQTLNLIVDQSAAFVLDGRPVSLIMSGKKGELLSDVLARSLNTSLNSGVSEEKKREISVNISDAFVLHEDWNSPYKNIFSLSQFLKRLFPDGLTSEQYSGIQLVCQKGRIDIFDGTHANEPIPILAHELIGQPTWVERLRVSFKTPMRADLQVGDIITLPLDVLSVLAVNNSLWRLNKNTVNFTGTFQILSMRHIGEYRNPSGDAWVTTFEVANVGYT